MAYPVRTGLRTGAPCDVAPIARALTLIAMVDDSASSERLHEAQRTARQLVAEDSVWLVYELRPLPFDRRNAPSLIFESDSTIRRVRNYPERWRELSDEELFALSWSQ